MVNTPKVNVDMDVENPWFPYNLPIHIYICIYLSKEVGKQYFRVTDK